MSTTDTSAPPLPALPDRDTRPSRGVAWLLMLTGIAAVLAALAGLGARATGSARTTADEPYYLMTAQSLASDGDLDISNQLAQRSYLPFHELTVDPQTAPLRDGRRLSPHDPLLPLLLSPAVAIGGWAAAKAVMAVLAGLTAMIAAWVAIRHVGVSPSLAVVVVGGLFTGMPLAPYGSQIYPEMAAAMLVTITCAAILEFGRRTHPGTTRRIPSWVPLGVATMGVIALPWLSVKYVPVTVAIAAVAAWRLWRTGHRQSLWAAGTLLIVAGVAYLLAHHLLYGGWTVYAAGDHFQAGGELSVVGTSPDLVGRSRRLVGLVVDRSFGIATWSPAWLLIPAAALNLFTRRHDTRGALVLPVATAWLVATFVALTMQGWWVPGRQIVVVLPLAAVAISRLVHDIPRLRTPVTIAVALSALNWLWLAAEATFGTRTLVVDFMSTTAPAYRLLAPLMPDGLRATPIDDVLLTVWAVVMTLGSIWLVRRAASGGAQ
ncbi:MAG: hypothetical protein ACR2HR_08060 [Euzebya sp.]